MAVRWGGHGPGHLSRWPKASSSLRSQLAARLTANGGWLWDFTDRSTLYQTTDTSTPVTAPNDPVGRAADLIAGFAVLQATALNKPLWKQGAGLLFDGTNTRLLSSANMDLTGTNKVMIVVGTKKLSDAANAVLVEHGNAETVGGKAITIACPRSGAITGAALQFRDGTNTPEVRAPNAAAPQTWQLTALADYSQATVALQARLFTNGSATGNTNAGVVASGSFDTLPLAIGRRSTGTGPYNGYITGLCITPYHDATTRTMAEQFIASLNLGLP